MSNILYYSNYCDKCQSLIKKISSSNIKKDIHFLCIDKRTVKENGQLYIILENSQEVLLPSTITKVPAMILLNGGHKILYGKDILTHLKPEQDYVINKSNPNLNDPECFKLGNNLSGITSDNFSFLDQTSNSMLAKGDGGLRQLHGYATLDYNDKINTPADDYEPDTIGELSLDKIQRDRENALKG